MVAPPSHANVPPGLSREAARRFYDHFGRRQDLQWFYERPAVERLLAEGAFENAQRIFEFGSGTGRVAQVLLRRHLRTDATYTADDSSATMVALAGARLAGFGAQVTIQLTDGSPQLTAPDGSFDRFVSLYVLDLLSSDDIASLVAEAHRVLRVGGRLCLVGLTDGVTVRSRCAIGIWRLLYRIRPSLVGGCRPLRLLDWLSDAQWEVRYHEVVVACAIPSEVVVASRR